MARLFGLIGNRSDLAGRVLAHEADALRVRAGGTPLGWGVGFYQGGEVLMRRRPLDDRESIEIAKLAGDVRADVVIGHVRSATVGSLRTENAHPFRYRQWLFAQTGTLPTFGAIRERLLGSVPGFLRPSIRGETDAEIFFYVFLSFLHDAGRLNEATTEASRVRDALRSSVSLVDGMSAEVGGGGTSVNAMLSDGETVYALHCGGRGGGGDGAGGEGGAGEMGYRVYAGKSDAELLLGDDQALRRKTPEIAQLHFTLIASDFDEQWSLTSSSPGAHTRWKSVADRAIVTLERGNDPHVDKL